MNPCTGCKTSWSAGRGTSCQEFCQRLAGWKGEQLDKEEICRQAIEKYGSEQQIIKAIEELSELQKELCKQLIGKGNPARIAEESADVNIMLKQIEMLFEIEVGVESFVEFKLRRLKKRMESSN